MKLENEKQKIDDFFDSHTDAEIKAKFDKYSWQNKSKKQFFIYGVMRSNLALLWWGWTTLWGVIGIIVGCIKLWNYYA